MAKTSEASVQDDGLWRKLLTRAQEGISAHGFFVVDVVEGCLHTSMFCKLGFPTSFMRNHFRNLNERIILEGPDGYQWFTMLGLEWDSQPCLMHGWKEFAMAYNLEIQDQVLFLSYGNSHFLVQVYDVNNKVKERRSFTPPFKVSTSNGDANAMSVNQAETRAYHSDLSSMHGVKTGGKEKKVILILDSSDDEEERERKMQVDEPPVPAKQTPIDASITGGANSKMTLRSAKKLENGDTQGHSMKDVSKEQSREHVQLDSEEEFMDRKVGNIKRRDSTSQSAPSSPEHVTAFKRSRRLQRKSGGCQEDDSGRATRVLRSGKLYKPSPEVEKLPPRLYEDASEPADVTKAAFKRGPGSEVLTSCCSTQQSTMKKQRRQLLQENTSKISEPQATDSELPANTESGPERAAPETPGGVPVVQTRPKVEALNDGGEKTSEKVSLSEDEAKKGFIRVGAPVKTLNLLYISRRRPVTTEERQATLAAARSRFANMVADEYCVMQLRTSQVYCGFHLKVQPDFVEAMQLPSSRLKVLLLDESGKTWEVEWLGDESKRLGLHSAGWTKFVLEHYLEEGDVCVFQKSKGVHNMISVKIFPVLPLVAPPQQGWRSHYMVPEIAHTVAYSKLPYQA